MTNSTKNTSFLASLVVAAAALVPVAGCDLDVGDLNNPGLDELETNPTRVNVGAASTGLLIGNRRNHANPNGFVAQLGILGREAYNFDPADPRFINELLKGRLSQGSPFGGNFWGGSYANIRLANLIQAAVPKVADFSAEERSAILGFSNTIEAFDLLDVVVTRDTNGLVIDTDRPLEDGVAPIVDRAAGFVEIARLLDEGRDQLAMGGETLPFVLSSGFAGFDTPVDFLAFNRGIRARAAAYAKDYAAANTALAASFLTETASLAAFNVGPSYTYSTAGGDVTNGLIAPSIYAHPSVTADAVMNDQRLARKTATAARPGGSGDLASTIAFTLYASPSTPLPIMRVEELLLLRAEARWFTGDQAGALTDLNLVRTVSGGLAAIAAPATDAAFITALLYERRYSLLFEGGHRWIDLRRFDLTSLFPLDRPDHVRNLRYPIPAAECNARPASEPACALSSF